MSMSLKSTVRFECQSCLGRYNPNQLGRYYHTCPVNIVNPRNENVKSSKDSDMKKEGKGVKVVKT